jgi:hypothetical protein
VPANVVGIVMKAQPGAELNCTARNHRFQQDGKPVDRGVTSYYAARTLAEASTIGNWLELMKKMADADRRQGRIHELQLPAWQILGEPATRLPGDS